MLAGMRAPRGGAAQLGGLSSGASSSSYLAGSEGLRVTRIPGSRLPRGKSLLQSEPCVGRADASLWVSLPQQRTANLGYCRGDKCGEEVGPAGQGGAAQLYPSSQQPRQRGPSGPLRHLQKNTWAWSRVPLSTGCSRKQMGSGSPSFAFFSFSFSQNNSCWP